MPVATAAQVRAGIAAYLTAQIGLRTIADGETMPSPPVAVVLPAAGRYISYEVSLEQGVAEYYFRIIVLLAKSDVRAATVALDGYLSTSGATSIAAALYKDPTCGGIADYVHPVEAVWSGELSFAGIDYMGGQISVEAAAE